MAEKLRYYRCKAGLTITQLAERAGLTTASLSKYEHGKRIPQVQFIRVVCSALGIPSYLITAADRMPEDTLHARYEKARMFQCFTKNEINSEIGFSHKTIAIVFACRHNPQPETIEKIEKYCNRILNEYRQ